MFTKNFKQLSKSDVSIAGGKGASLGEMTQAGISVPPGFVILSGAFEQFVEETRIRADIEAVLNKVKHNDTNSIEQASEKIQAIILGQKLPKAIGVEIQKEFKKLGAKFVAVRSSATSEDSSSAAWAGQLDTYLNTTEKDLLLNVKKCWASLFTPRAIFYRFEKGLQKEFISVAVVVQKMVQSEISGIAFSVHPVTQDYNQMIIEAGYGLGEAIVSGSITPDSYVVKKKEMGIEKINVNRQEKKLSKAIKGNEWKTVPVAKQEKQKLSKTEIIRLSQLILKIEKHYGFPCDIEWAKEGSKFYITQSRPITTLTRASVSPAKSLYVKSYARDFCLPIIQMWCRAETTNPRQWTNKVNPKLPFEIFIRENGLVTDYMDETGVDWIKGELKQLIKKDKNFVKKVVKEFYKRIKDIKPIWENLTTLNRKQLVDYFHAQEDVWAWFEAVWWTMEMVPEKSEAFKLTHKARVSTERMVPNGDVLIRESLRKIFPKLGKYSEALTIEEVASGKPPTTNELKKRMTKYSFTNAQLFVGEGVPEMEKRFGVKIQVQVTEGQQIFEFSGQVAYPGKVRGVVRKLFSRADVADLKSGEILVSPMTMPDYLPAMYKSAAFITDEGGVTSHAAIVARELKKPCVIGTKIATEVLKDGDLVEVDADNGIIKIINK